MDPFDKMLQDGLTWPEAVLGLGLLAFAFGLIVLFIAVLAYVFGD